MPNRFIKETIRGSDTLASVSPDAERLFWRLVVSADDFGRFDARPNIVLGQCLTAFITTFTPKQIESWLDELERVDIIRRYEHEGRQYLVLTNWDKHQQRRAKASKFPDPPARDSKCKQTIANVPVFVFENENEFVYGFENENENENENGPPDVKHALNEVAATSVKDDMNLSSSLDLKYRNALRIYESSGFGPLDSTVQQTIDSMCDDFTENWFTQAVEEAVLQNKRRLAYVRSILQNWRAEGGVRRSGGMDVELTVNSRRNQSTRRSDDNPKKSITGGQIGWIAPRESS